MTISLRWGAATDTGRLRPANEDAAFADEWLFAVADGVGGHVAGEVASSVAIDTLRARAGDDGLTEAVRVANRAVHDRAVSDPSLRGMGTTLTAAALVEHEGRDQLLVVNVGDSRAYLLRDGELVQISEDHSLVADLEREGRITAEEAWVHPRRNIVTRVLGEGPDVVVDEFWLDPFRGDRLLLCSDGLSDMIQDPEIERALRAHPDPVDASAELVRLANEAGGRDNITVVVVDVADDGGKARDASAQLAGTRITSRPVERVVDEPTGVHRRAAPLAPSPTTTSSRLTWRAAAFGVALLAVVVVAVGGTWWFARSGYYVAARRGNVTIFRGRPDGVLFLHPTVERRTAVRLADLPPARRTAVEDRREFTDKNEVERFVQRLREATTTTTTTPPGDTATSTATTAGVQGPTTPTSAP